VFITLGERAELSGLSRAKPKNQRRLDHSLEGQGQPGQYVIDRRHDLILSDLEHPTES
jgi:hypothetical protein